MVNGFFRACIQMSNRIKTAGNKNYRESKSMRMIQSMQIELSEGMRMSNSLENQTQYFL